MKRKLDLAEKKVNLKEKNQRIAFLLQGIALAKEEIVTFKDEPEIKVLAIERYKDMHSELKQLTKISKI